MKGATMIPTPEERYRFHQGDVLERLREMPAESVHCVVTSPPYYGLRDYGVPGAIGLERTLPEYLDKMVAVFCEVRRVLRRDGTAWVNLGDSYASAWSCNRRSIIGQYAPDLDQRSDRRSGFLKEKDLMMVPARLAIALCDDGWYLRSEITWCKRAPMPESCQDRPTSATERIYLLSRSPRYYYDADAVREEYNADSLNRYAYQFGKGPAAAVAKSPAVGDGSGHNATPNPAGRNMWNYWLLSPEAFPEAHFATFPTEIPRRAILAGTSERGCCPHCGAPWGRVKGGGYNPFPGSSHDHTRDLERGGTQTHASGVPAGTIMAKRFYDKVPDQTLGWHPTCKCPHTEADVVPATVLDPFSGAGTSVLVALRLGRRAIGIELNPEYIRMSERRVQSDPEAMNLRMRLEA